MIGSWNYTRFRERASPLLPLPVLVTHWLKWLYTSTPTGRMILTVMAAVATLERDVINERTQGGRKAKADQGGYAYGAPKLGQKAVDKALVLDEAEREVITLIKKHRRSGKSLSAITDWLNANNIPTKRGKAWYHATVKNALAASS